MSSYENPGNIQIKIFEESFGIIDGKEVGTDSVRYFVALYKGLPYTPEADTALPRPAVSILRKEAVLSEAVLAEISDRTVTIDISHIGEGPVEYVESTENYLKGKTTFAELYEWGVSKKEIEEVLSLPVGANGESVRDYLMNNNIQFSAVKDKIQLLIDN